MRPASGGIDTTGVALSTLPPPSGAASAHPPLPRRRIPTSRQAVAALAIAGSLVWLVWQQLGPWDVALAVALPAALATGLSWVERRTIALAIGMLVAAVDYFIWRVGVVNLAVFWIGIPLVAAEMFGALHALGFQYTVWPRGGSAPRKRRRARAEIRRQKVRAAARAMAGGTTLRAAAGELGVTTRTLRRWTRLPGFEFELTRARSGDGARRRDRSPFLLPTYVLIPTVDEGVEVLEPTLRGVIRAVRRYRAVYPEARITVIVCDDGLVAGAATTSGDVQDLCRRLRVACVTRTVGGGAKAGNLEHTRDVYGVHGDALCAIFDADQVPEPDFFLRTIPPFADPTIGWVQTGQYYRNLENRVARWANDQQALFYRVVCPGKATQNSVFICGTNVVLRAAALDEIGGLPQDSVTEDFAASVMLHGRWRSIYIEGVLARGLGPVDLGSYFKQQNRWARGTLGTFSQWRAIAGRSGFTVEQRIQYALACTHYLAGVRDVTYVLAPAIVLLTGAAAVQGASLDGFLGHFLPYFVISQVAFWHRAAGKTTWRGIVIGFASFPTLIAALLSVVSRRRQGFMHTSKQRAAASILPSVPHLVTAAVVLAAVCVGTWGHPSSRALVSAVWLVYTLTMLAAFITLAAGDASPSLERMAVRARERLMGASGRLARPLARPVLSRALVGLVVAATAAAVALPQIYASPAAARFGGVLHASQRVSLGLHAQGVELDRARALLGRADVVGTTIELGAGFPRAWADSVTAQGATPWLTLTFAVHGQRTLASSVRGIANGVNDAALTTFARDARTFGRPLLLTVLPAVDRDWSASSAVAYGGIPQDVAPAWSRIRGLFANAVNVALVWAPADPLRDQPYSPPADQIDVVQATWYAYSGTAWPDPELTLQALALRHPGKPILIDVSSDGPATDKEQWLADVVRAAAHHGAIVVYHEGGPFTALGAPGRHAWSLTTLTAADVCQIAHAADGTASRCTPTGYP
jgi:cellulose synthase/poly-beta-1,6-N-acetylglucosamine synthase-like glycosyltransferase